MLREIPLTEVEHLKIHGRTNGSLSPLTIFWTASGFEVRVTGTELWALIEGDFKLQEPWISLEVNGAWVGRQMVERGKRWVCLFRNRSPQAVKQVRLYKDMQAMSQDPDHLLQVHAFKTDGRFLPIPERPQKLEFIGDSITSGEGAIGAVSEEDWVAMLFSAKNNYATMVGELLDADVRILSQSGWGVVSGWDNDPRCALPPHYTKLCGLLSGEHNRALGAHRPYDFSQWQPDAVVVNLGTNDCGALSSPAWTDPVTGETFQQRKSETGGFLLEDQCRFQSAVKQFLAVLRESNPNAQLLWAYGMLGNELSGVIAEAVREYALETGDRKAAYLELTNAIEHRGARFHPGKRAHEIAAEEIAEKLRELLQIVPPSKNQCGHR